MLSIEEGQDYENIKEDDLPFEHLQNIGFGHSGNVEKIRDKATNAIFARKTIRITTRRLDRTEKSKVFQNEVRIIRALASHHHIIRVFATYSTESIFGLILDPLASDGDLDTYLDRYWRIVDEAKDSDTPNPSPNLEAMVTVLEQAFGCLATGHAFMSEKRIRHRDIKPKNILVHNGRVLYIDFGYSFDSSRFSHSTTEGRPSFLTRKYSAPEVLEYEKKSSKSDVFSLGCVFVELLSALLQIPDLEREVDCYSTRITEIHEWLNTVQVPPKYSTLPGVLREMTLHERSERPFAKDVVLRLRALPKLFCEQCSLVSTPLTTHTTSTSHAIKKTANVKFVPPSNESESLTWSAEYQRWLRGCWDMQYQRWYWKHHVDGQGWIFFDWVPTQLPVRAPTLPQAQQSAPEPRQRSPFESEDMIKPYPNHNFKRVSATPELSRQLLGSYSLSNSQNNSSYEKLDPSYCVRSKEFFALGKVFSVLFTEPAGNTLVGYNDAVSYVKFGDKIHAQIRRFIVVRQRKAFCYAIPIFTYGNQGTKKPGVVPDEHAIAYSYGTTPTLLSGEKELWMEPICIVINDGGQRLSPTSRIFFGVHHPVQYNVKVKDLGYVHPDHLVNLSRYWTIHNQEETDRAGAVTAEGNEEANE